MSHSAVLKLDSYRLAQYAIQVPCYICDGPNTVDAEFCRNCHAPMALAHHSASQKLRPNMLAVVGSAAAGKTVYLGMLTDMLSRHDFDLRILARGAYSITLQQTTTAALARCEFPPKTPNEPDRWNWVHCRVQSEKLKQPVELIMPDVAGESLCEEIDHPHSYPAVRSFLSKSGGVLLLIDTVRLMEGDADQDFFGMKMITYLYELNDDPKKGWPVRPVSVIFAKADQYDTCFDDPTAFARRHTPGLWQTCQDRLRRHRFFAASVAGACSFESSREGRAHIPLRIEPRGIVEPFSWLVSQMANGKPR